MNAAYPVQNLAPLPFADSSAEQEEKLREIDSPKTSVDKQLFAVKPDPVMAEMEYYRLLEKEDRR